MNFDLGKFEAFCAKLRIDSKERGRVPLKWIGSQKYLFQEIADGLNNGIHTFVILKGRQMGISTGMLALDLYWLFKHPGIQGGVVTDTDENRELFRSLLTQYMESLPSSAKPEKDAHNRTQLILKNSARLMYLVAGIRKSGGLGRAKAFNFLHATECSSWGDEEGFQSLMNTLAQQNPDRLYIFESTARGYDMFYETWEVAKKSNTQKAIFIGWWRNEFYRKERTSPEFRSYWDGELTPDEKVWVQEVWELYNVNIVPEQIAWWRWYVTEQMKGDEQMALQEMPPCVTAETRVGTDEGMIRIADARNGMLATRGRVVDTHANAATSIFKMKTLLGYELRGTGDHPVFLPSGVLLHLKDCVGSDVALAPPRFAAHQYVCKWRDGPMSTEIVVDEDFARMVGIFMGDGSFQVRKASRHIENASGTLSVSFTTEDEDFIEFTTALISRIFGLTGHRSPISPNGAIVEFHSVILTKVFKKLGLIRSNYGPTQRNVHVPEFIFRSPKNVVAAFLQGLFETDGFVDRRGARVVLFSKYPEFMRDVQILLLGFGITSRRIVVSKKSKDKNGRICEYTGSELRLRKEETIVFVREIGFLSARKRTRCTNIIPKFLTNQLPLVMQDRCVSVIEDGFEPVYNLTVEGDHAFDANGILTHNTESYAFQLSGSRFFSAERTNMHYQFAIQQDRKFFRYDFGLNFEDTKFIETNEDNAEVCIWAWPEEHNDPSRPQPQYVLGCDPAYGSSEWADEFAGYGARCYADKLEQVFQIGTTSWTEAQYAWVILHLAGYYGNTLLALEMQGPGGAVLNEIRNVQNRASSLKAADPMKGIFDVVGNVRNYLWRKQDSMASGYALQWQTNHKEKIRMFSQTRSYFERDMLIIKSPECLAQFRNIHRQGDQIGGEGRAKDDQVVAMCIATIAWNDNLLVELQATNQTYVLMNRPPEEIRLKSPLENSVKDFLTKQGIHFRAIS